MKASATVCTEAVPVGRTRLSDYLELSKPRVGLLVLFTVAVGAWLAAPAGPAPATLLHALIGTALVVAGASALNQVLECGTDALMARTENRPLPSGRLSVLEAIAFGTLLGVAGICYLGIFGSGAAAVVAVVAFVSYAFIYTPLKRRTTLNTLVGAVPGALPPVIGWAAIRGSVGNEALLLFCILFLWQVPHFLAIAWIYREDYGRAGLQMLPTADPMGQLTSRHMLVYGLALLAVSLSPGVMGLAGPWYVAGALVLGLGFMYSIIGFARKVSENQARRVLRASLVYLPALLTFLLADSVLTHGTWGAGG
jgi:protoheme IX farnesyltransferase